MKTSTSAALIVMTSALFVLSCKNSVGTPEQVARPEALASQNVIASMAAPSYAAPFLTTSAFKRPIGSGAQYSAIGEAITTDLHEVQNWTVNTNNGWSSAIATCTSSDPMVTVTCSSTDPNRNVNFPYRMRIPQGFPMSSGVQAETADGRVCLYNSTTGRTHEFYKFKWNNGSPTADIHYTDDPNVASNPANPTPIRISPEVSIISGLGHIGAGNAKAGTRGSGVSGFGGLIRASELTAANTWPKHPLALDLAFGQLASTYQWPANAMDWDAATKHLGTIKYGTLVAIPHQSKGGPALSSLGVNATAMRIAKALVFYGAYVVDRRGNNAGLSADQYTVIDAQTLTDIRKLVPYLRVVKNNSSSQTVSGGGTAFPQ